MAECEAPHQGVRAEQLEATGISVSAEDDMQVISETGPHDRLRRSALVAPVTLIVGLALGGCDPNTQKVDCSSIREGDTHHVKFRPPETPGKIAIKTESGKEVKITGFFKEVTKKVKDEKTGDLEEKTDYYAHSNTKNGSYTKIPGGKGKSLRLDGFTIKGHGDNRPTVVCPE